MNHPAQLPEVAVVIVNYRRPADTLECLQSLAKSSHVRLKITVVDNGSEDNSVEQIRSAYPEIALLPLPKNLGFAGGYNAGIRKALEEGAETIFLLNNDTTLHPDAVRNLVEAGWDAGVPKILFHSRPDIIWAAGCRWRSLPPSVAMNGLGQQDSPAFNEPIPLEYATGCALMATRQALVALQGFDRDLENYMEDYDFCYRLRHAGFSLGYVPSARIWHKVSQTLGEYSPERWKHQGKNTVLFYRKGGRFPRFWLWIFLGWVMLREAAKGHWSILPAFWSGAREGFRSLKRLEVRSSGG